LALAASVIALLPQAAPADALSAANWDRLHSCVSASPRVALTASTKLRRAAERLASGETLANAIAQSGYLAAESVLIHLSGPSSDREVERLLAAHYCNTLTNPKLRDFGAERRGAEIWMVLAAPVSLPAAGDALFISQRILSLINDARASGRRCGGKYFASSAPLQLNDALTRAALEHSRDMASHDEFDHRGHDGSTPAARVERAGFGAHRIVGENIAAGAMTANEVTQGWLASPAHCENIMDARFTNVGIAFAENPKTRAAVFWTQDFAGR
jgi:Cysteine-rich secretory protein family